VTERRPGEERKRSGAVPGSGVPPERVSEESPVIELQELAGNRAVTQLLATQSTVNPRGSAGFRVRDLLRASRVAVPSTVQRETFIEDEKAGSGEKAGSYEKVAFDEKAGSYEKAGAFEKSGGFEKVAFQEKSGGFEKVAFQEKSGGFEKVAFQEKSGGFEKVAFQEKSGGRDKAMGPRGTAPTLAVGSAGPAVARLQGFLAGAGFAVTPDGSFGPRTRAAVVAFQAGQGLAADGIVGPMTWAALEAPGTAKAAGAAGELVALGEMGMAGQGPGMEAAEAAGSGAGEASLPDEIDQKKELK